MHTPYGCSESLKQVVHKDEVKIRRKSAILCGTSKLRMRIFTMV